MKHRNGIVTLQRHGIDLQNYHIYFIFYVRRQVLSLEG